MKLPITTLNITRGIYDKYHYKIMLLPIQIASQVVYRLQFLRRYLITFYKRYILYQISAMQIFLPVLSALNLLINATYFTLTNKNVL